MSVKAAGEPRGWEFGDMVWEMTPSGKLIFFSRKQPHVRYQLNLGGASEVLDVHKTSQNPDGTKTYETICYSNSTTFQFFRQRFTEPVDFIAFGIRRRDGSTMDGGYRHGDVKFSVPLQSKSFRDTCVDPEFASAVVRAISAGSPVANRLVPALSLFNLANTDSDVMQQEAEVILTGAAFEQLLDSYGARELSETVGRLLQPYGSITVDQAIKSTRPDIVLNPKFEAEQRGWPLHRKWAEELYHLRNNYIHGGDFRSRTWGWHPLEHLIMGAFIFPLIVKLLLVVEGHYALTENDEVKFPAVDKVLAVTGWGKRVGSHSNATAWQETLFSVRRELLLSRAIYKAVEELKKKGIELEDPDESVTPEVSDGSDTNNQ